MDDRYNRPITRDDLLFTIEMALRKAERYWPKKRLPGDHDRLRPIAEKVVEHMELCGIKCFGRPRGPGHSTPAPLGIAAREPRRRRARGAVRGRRPFCLTPKAPGAVFGGRDHRRCASRWRSTAAVSSRMSSKERSSESFHSMRLLRCGSKSAGSRSRSLVSMPASLV